MIPKIIHFCWFGEQPISEKLEGYIKGWKKILPEYQFMFWNEKNIDFNETVFLKQAYENKKYAFVSDYVRLKVLYEYGGIYLDTDVEILKDISTFLDNELLLGFDSINDALVSTCFIGASKKMNL